MRVKIGFGGGIVGGVTVGLASETNFTHPRHAVTAPWLALKQTLMRIKFLKICPGVWEDKESREERLYGEASSRGCLPVLEVPMVCV